MFILIFINSVVLFILMQILGIPLSNLTVINFKYDTFLFSDDKTTSGMNIIYNIMLSNIYMLLVYEVVKDVQVKKYTYLIVIGYFLIRYIYIIFVLNRIYLLNLKYEATLVVSTLFCTYLIYSNIIIENISMKIPIEEFKNEIVLLGILFLFSVFKDSITKMFSNRDNTSERTKYIVNMYLQFFDKYNLLIDKKIEDLNYFSKDTYNDKQVFKLLVYSIMIYENFSRPNFYRRIENGISKITGSEKTTGIMQIKSERILSDEESIVFGIDILLDSFTKYTFDEMNDNSLWISEVCEVYNPQDGNGYIQEITYIFNELKKIVLLD